MIAFTSEPCGKKPSHEVAQHYWQQAVDGPVNSFLARSGKRIRADLVELAYALSGGKGSVPEQLQGFVELLHAGSLIVDDFQDGAETRRGEAALHKRVGAPLAINTGNWMYFAAFEKLTELNLMPARHVLVMRKALATVRRCHEGQALDISVDVRAIPKADATSLAFTISKLKTGGLVSLAAWLGAAVAGGNPELRKSLGQYGLRLGIALQMQNDLAELKKCASEGVCGSDLIAARVTWPWAWAAQICSEDEFSTLQQLSEIKDVGSALHETVAPLGSKVISNKLRNATRDLLRHVAMGTEKHNCRKLLQRLEQYHV